MAYVSVQPGLHWPFGSMHRWVSAPGTAGTLDATAEKLAFIGRLWTPTGIGTSKTISAAGGGSISFRLGTTTWTDTTSTVEIGIQDVATATSPGRPDGTFDVSRTLTSGAGLTSAAWNTVAMTGGSGSKTIAHGDLIAVVFDMTNRTTDSIIIQAPLNVMNTGQAGSMPTVSLFTGAWASVNGRAPNVVIAFDDGTLGFIDAGPPVSAGAADLWTNATNPDERGMIFQVPFACKIDGFWVLLRIDSGSADVAFKFYETPLGSPNALATHTIVAETFGAVGDFNVAYSILASELTLTKNTDYCLAVRNATAAQSGLFLHTLGHADHRQFYMGGTNLRGATRDNDSGAFSEDTTAMRIMGVRVSQVDDGTGAGGASKGKLTGLLG